MLVRTDSNTRKIAAALALAHLIGKNSEADDSERDQALSEARAQGVSVFDSLRTHLLLEIANGSGPLVNLWLTEVEMEFGNFNDNCQAFRLTQNLIATGEVEQGLVGLCLLRDHIIKSNEIKSFTHLLPTIRRTIEEVAHL
jgi:hypothetical protein